MSKGWAGVGYGKDTGGSRWIAGETRPIWTKSRDTVRASEGRTHTSNQATLWRWREAYQHDFAARMDWCVKPWAEANHNPLVVVNGVAGRQPLRMAAAPGGMVSLSAAGSSDPDRIRLSLRCFYCLEAGEPGPRPAELSIRRETTEVAQVSVPKGEWADLHLILEVRDDGDPSLCSYRRVIIPRRP